MFSMVAVPEGARVADPTAVVEVADGSPVFRKDPGRGRSSWVRRVVGAVGPAAASLVLVLVAWELLAHSGVVKESLFPTPRQTWDALVVLERSGVLWSDLGASLNRAWQGYLIGASLGVAIGFATGRSRVMSALLGPMISFLRPIPAIAVVPLSTAWFGIGERSKIFIIAYAVLLAVWLYVHDGVERMPTIYLRVARNLGLSWRRIFVEILLPAAGPAIVAALRYGSSVAFLALVAAELGGTQSGIAYRLQIDAQFLQTNRIFAGLVELGLLGVTADVLISRIGRRIVHWTTP